MESALRPRDIQARIRAGERVEDVAQAAGVPVERLAAFAAPVLAERDHVAGLAQTHPVRRRGEAVSHRNLRNAVVDQLARLGIDLATLSWDSWKVEDRRWRVVVRYIENDNKPVEASFTYDQTGRFSIASDEAARELIDDRVPPVMGADRPGSATNGGSAPDEVFSEAGEYQDDGPASVLDPHASAVAAEDYSSDDTEDAYSGGELAEVDGVYDILPSKSNLDVLYDMLASFDEDSVKIYSGLVDPERTPSQSEALQAAAASEPEIPVETSMADPQDPPQPDQVAQPSLLGDGGAEPTQPIRKRGRKRAAVPTWDEIMFGTPRKDDR